MLSNNFVIIIPIYQDIITFLKKIKLATGKIHTKESKETGANRRVKEYIKIK